ncbi:MAG TPA: hypothetical protein VHW09_27370 [Bryobacteraceae bacterium]|jgi:hypothetical protein|nr:hypothetical protein [Bryobacteraceae bacterium]
MMPSQNQQQSPMNIENFQTMMMNLVYLFTSVVTWPIEMVLRPQYGSEYFSPVTQFGTAVMMLFLPLFTALSGMIPYMHFRTLGLFGIASLSKLFFLGSLVHGFRVWRRMLHMEKEDNSYFPGEPLFFFRWLPFSWWVTRIVIEPAFVFIVALTLANLFILQPSATNYLMFAAIALAMKSYVEWFLQWQMIRHLMNARYMGPIMAKLVNNTATESDLAKAHLASFPKNLPDDIRQSAARHVARAFNPEKEI